MANKLDFSLVFKADNKDLQQKLNEVKRTFAQTINQFTNDAQKLQNSSLQAQAALSRVFEAKTDKGLASALESASNKISKLKDGAKFAENELVLLDKTANSALENLRIRAANAEQRLKQLKVNKGSFNEILEAEKNLSVLNTSVSRTQNAFTSLKNAINTSVGKSDNTLKQLGESLKTINASKLKEIGKNAEPLPSKITEVSKSVSVLGNKLIGLGGAYIGLSKIKESLESIADAGLKFEALKSRFDYAFGQDSQNQLNAVKDLANSLGLETVSLQNQYSKLASSTKELNVTNAQTWEIFKGVTTAGAAMRLTNEEIEGSIYALSQIASKGKVSMEELRGQLGERLPAAMQISAKAMGVTTQELESMISKGISAENFLPKLGKALEETFGKQAAANANSLNAQINRLKSNFNEFKIELFQGGGADFFASLTKSANDAIEYLRDAYNSIDFTPVKNAIASIYEDLKTNFSNIYDAAKDLISLLGDISSSFKLWGEANKDATVLEQTIFKITQTLQILNGITNSVVSSFSAIAGTATLLFSGLLKIVKDLALALNAFGVVSDETVKKLEQTVNKSLQLSDKLFTTSSKSFENASKSFSKAMQDQATSVENSASNSKKSLQKACDEAKLNAEKAADEVNKVYAKLQSETGKIGVDAAKAAYEAAQKNAEVAQQAADKAKAALEGLSESAKTAEKVIDVAKLGQATLKEYGLTAEQAFGRVDKSVQKSLDNLPKLEESFLQLGATAKEQSNAIKTVFDNLINSSKSTADLEAVKSKLIEMGQKGYLSLNQLKQQTKEIDEKLNKLKNSTDEVSQAFERMGVKTKQELEKAALQAREDYEIIKKSGKASAEQLEKAFTSAKEAQIAAGNQASKSWLQAEENARKYDSALKPVKNEVNSLTDAHDQLTKSEAQSTQAAVQGSRQRASAYANEAKEISRLADLKNTLDGTAFKDGSKEQQARETTFKKTTHLNKEGLWEEAKSKGLSFEQFEQVFQNAKQELELRLGKGVKSFGGDFAALTRKLTGGYDINAFRKGVSDKVLDNAKAKELQDNLKGVAGHTYKDYNIENLGNINTQNSISKNVNLTLDLGGKSFETLTDEKTALSLESLVKQLQFQKGLTGK